MLNLTMAVVAGWLAGLLSLAAFVPYILSTLRGHTKPNRATWSIWMVNSFVIAASYYSSGATNTIWVAVGYSIGSLVTAILSYRFGTGGWTWLDRNCLTMAAIALFCWWWFDSALIALLMSLSVDFAGALPTIRKAYQEPETEDRIAWSLFLSGNCINLMAIDRWMFKIVIYPAYMVLASGLIALLVLRPRLHND
jgi:hypothetical protein